MTTKKTGKLYIISGPSGSGKSTILRSVLENMPDIYFSVSATTRQPRPGEVHGEHYHFLSQAEFDQLVEADGLLEYAQYVGNSYGTPAEPIREKLEAGVDVLLDIEVQGAEQIKEKMPEAVAIFLSPPSLEILEERLRNRGTDSEEKIKHRLETARRELEQVARYDFLVVNDTIEQAVQEVQSIVKSEGGSPK